MSSERRRSSTGRKMITASIGCAKKSDDGSKKKSTASKIDEQLLQYLPRGPYILKSVDTIQDAEDVVKYTREFLSSLEPPGLLLLHRVKLKVGTPRVLLRKSEPPTPQ